MSVKEFAEIGLRLCELHRRSKLEVLVCFVCVRFMAVDEAIIPHDSEPVQAFAILVFSTPFEPHPSHLHVTLEAISTEIHSTQVSCGTARIFFLLLLSFVPLIFLAFFSFGFGIAASHRWITRGIFAPYLPCHPEEVLLCQLYISR